MGVAGVTKIIKDVAPKAIKYIKFKDFKDKKIAVDTLLLIYKFMISIRGKHGPIRRSDGKVTSHIYGFFSRIKSYLINGIHPVFVFDGRAPVIKGSVLQRRRLAKEKALEILNTEEGLTAAEKLKLEKMSVTITDVEIQDVKTLCRLFGVPIIQSLEEADPQCASLNITNKVYGVASEDIDILFFGAPRLLKDFSESSGTAQMIDLDQVLATLNLSQEQWVEFGVILGCDYCPTTIKGLKGTNALKVYQKYKSINALIKGIDKDKSSKYTVPQAFKDNWKAAKDYYLKAPVYDPKVADLTWNKPDYQGLMDFMVRDHEFNKQSVKKILVDVEAVYKYYKTHGRFKGHSKSKK